MPLFTWKAIGVGAVLVSMAGLAVTAPEPATASAAGTRADRHAVRSGDARFEVLSPTLIRMEYAGNGTFTDAATFNAIGRDDFGRTPFTEKVAGGWLTIDTDRLTLKYKVGSGPFTAQNVSVRLRTGNQMVTGHPTWPAPATCAAGTLCEAERTAPGAPYPSPAASATPCDYGAVCEAENGALTGGAALNTDHNGYSGGGFVAGLQKAGATDTVSLRDIPADGRYALQIRYGNGSSPATARTISTAVNGGTVTSTSLPATADWDTWSTATIPVTLTKGSDTVAIGCPAPDGCHVNLDTVAVTVTESPVLPPHSSLGGYRRGLDGVNGGALTTPGLLYRDGWYLLDDTASAVLDTATRTVHQRPSRHGKSYQDGYLFGYGQDYKQGLADLKTLTGPSKLLPRWAYGVWYSEYHDYTAANYEQTILPKFRSDGVPLDVLVTDTDFKAPNAWNGWEIDPSRFPDPKAFFDWSRSQGLHNTLNIHPSIVSSDPRFAQAQATAKGRLTNVGGCLAGAGFTCYTFDWSDPNQLKAYLDLHRTMEKQGADFWWLDWCCESSRSSMPGVTPDAWINQQYASDTAKNIGRGFAFSRAFGSLQAGGYSGRTGVPTGPWADKRTTVHFTGDTTSGWQTLRFETGYTPSESASTGLSPVSHDIGGFNGPSKLSDDLYVRWVQLGAFQPIMRLHGSHSDRLPWQYSDPARVAAEKFLNLRENLLPYTYTLAREAADTGVPAVRATYLEYPGQQGAYDSASKEYFYGSDVLVAPATSPGATATTSVWFPPGQWTDFFTGRTYTGPSTQNITTDWNSMPVFVKAGGIVPTRTDNVTNDVQNPLTKVTLNVAEGAGGSYSLHEDDGRSTAPNRSATTAVRYTENRRDHVLYIAPVRGTFKSQVTRRQWTVAFTNAAAPTVVHIDGVRVPAANWTFDKDRRTLTVTVPTRSVSTATTISYS